MGTYARQFSRRLGEILLEEGLITVDQLQQALKRQYTAGESLSVALVRMKAVGETDIARVISRELGCPYLDASRYDIPPEILHLIPVDVAVECLILPLDRIGRSLLLACTGAVPAEILDAIARRSKLRVFLCIATPSQILESIKRNGSRLLEAIRQDYETKTHAGAAGTA